MCEVGPLINSVLSVKHKGKWRRLLCTLEKVATFTSSLRFSAMDNIGSTCKVEDIVHAFISGVDTNHQGTIMLICAYKVRCLSFESFQELNGWVDVLKRNLICAYFHADLILTSKESNLYNYARRHRRNPLLGLLRHRRLIGCPLTSRDGYLHVTRDRICFTTGPGCADPRLLATWTFDNDEIVQCGTARLMDPASGEPRTEQASLFFLTANPEHPEAPGSHLFLSDRAAELCDWIETSNRAAIQQAEWRRRTSLIGADWNGVRPLQVIRLPAPTTPSSTTSVHSSCAEIRGENSAGSLRDRRDSVDSCARYSMNVLSNPSDGACLDPGDPLLTNWASVTHIQQAQLHVAEGAEAVVSAADETEEGAKPDHLNKDQASVFQARKLASMYSRRRFSSHPVGSDQRGSDQHRPPLTAACSVQFGRNSCGCFCWSQSDSQLVPLPPIPLALDQLRALLLATENNKQEDKRADDLLRALTDNARDDDADAVSPCQSCPNCAPHQPHQPSGTRTSSGSSWSKANSAPQQQQQGVVSPDWSACRRLHRSLSNGHSPHQQQQQLPPTAAVIPGSQCRRQRSNSSQSTDPQLLTWAEAPSQAKPRTGSLYWSRDQLRLGTVNQTGRSQLLPCATVPEANGETDDQSPSVHCFGDVSVKTTRAVEGDARQTANGSANKPYVNVSVASRLRSADLQPINEHHSVPNAPSLLTTPNTVGGSSYVNLSSPVTNSTSPSGPNQYINLLPASSTANGQRVQSASRPVPATNQNSQLYYAHLLLSTNGCAVHPAGSNANSALPAAETDSEVQTDLNYVTIDLRQTKALSELEQELRSGVPMDQQVSNSQLTSGEAPESSFGAKMLNRLAASLVRRSQSISKRNLRPSWLSKAMLAKPSLAQ